MPSLTILHTNDIHGRIEGLARIATLVEQIRAAQSNRPVLYVDAGDSEETANRLSNLTKGTAMHRLLSAAGCDAATVGNAAPLRYGHQVLLDHAAAADYPLLLANMRLPDGSPVPGVQLTALHELGGVRIGLLGVTAPMEGDYEKWLGLTMPPLLPLIRELVASLRQDGAEIVVLLSHLGLEADRDLAAGLQSVVDIIIGAHSHNLLSAGERIGNLLVVQAGEYAEHLGRIDLAWDGEQLTELRAAVLAVPETTPQSPRVLDEVAAIEVEVAHFLDEVIGELAAPLDFASDHECGVGNLVADMLRERMDADVALVAVGQAFAGPLPSGPLKRITLWEMCSSPANPGVVALTGARLQELIARGLDPAYAAERPRQLRGAARGLLHLSGARIYDRQLMVGGQPIDPKCEYRVAGTDWEFEHYGGYAPREWGLQPHYNMPTILREALEEYLHNHRPIRVEMGRLGGTAEDQG
jgi:2',3'-cyclic-nucleotide 2'-phosphodiesterase (5'-nucleotidase family)